MSSEPVAAALELAKPRELVRRRSDSHSWRDDWFFFCAAWIIAAVIVYGFAQTLSQRLLHAAIPRPCILWLHASVFFGWIGVFITQTMLVRVRRVRWHRILGVAGLLLGVMMPPIGLATSLVMGRFNIAHALRDPDFAQQLTTSGRCLAASDYPEADIRRPTSHSEIPVHHPGSRDLRYCMALGV